MYKINKSNADFIAGVLLAKGGSGVTLAEIQALLATKEDLLPVGTAEQFIAGDKTLQGIATGTQAGLLSAHQCQQLLWNGTNPYIEQILDGNNAIPAYIFKVTIFNNTAGRRIKFPNWEVPVADDDFDSNELELVFTSDSTQNIIIEAQGATTIILRRKSRLTEVEPQSRLTEVEPQSRLTEVEPQSRLTEVELQPDAGYRCIYRKTDTNGNLINTIFIT